MKMLDNENMQSLALMIPEEKKLIVYNRAQISAMSVLHALLE